MSTNIWILVAESFSHFITLIIPFINEKAFIITILDYKFKLIPTLKMFDKRDFIIEKQRARNFV